MARMYVKSNMCSTIYQKALFCSLEMASENQMCSSFFHIYIFVYYISIYILPDLFRVLSAGLLCTLRV